MAGRFVVVGSPLTGFRVYEETGERFVQVPGATFEETSAAPVGGTTPKGVLGKPLNRPMRGPVQ